VWQWSRWSGKVTQTGLVQGVVVVVVEFVVMRGEIQVRGSEEGHGVFGEGGHALFWKEWR